MTVISYDFIEHKVKIPNPFQFFYELKHHSVAHIIRQINHLLTLDNPEYLTDEVLEFASTGNNNFDALIHKNGVSSDYMAILDQTLTLLNKSGYIHCNHRTRFNESKHVLDMKITMLELLEKGKKTLEDLNAIKNINSTIKIKECLEACSLYVQVSDIMLLNRVDLIKTFEAICLTISTVPLISFEAKQRNSGFFDYYQGHFYVFQFDRFRQFLKSKNLFELEKVMNNIIIESILAITEAKLILSYLALGHFDQIALFMDNNKLKEHLNYLVNVEYLKIDYSIEGTHKNNQIDVVVNDFEITRSGKEYLESTILKRIKNYRNNDSLINVLKSLNNQKDYRQFIRETWLLKDIIVFHEGAL